MLAVYARYHEQGTGGRVSRDRTGLGPSRRALARRLRALRQAVQEEERQAYRAHFGQAVRTVSPLLLRVCECENLDLDVLVARMGPRGAWPNWLCGPGPDGGRRWKSERNGGGHTGLLDGGEFDSFAHGGLVVRGLGEPGGPFGLRALDRGLEMAAFLGDARLRTHGRTGSLLIRGDLPATLVAALPGRPLDHLVDHWLLAGAGCVVERVEEATRRGTTIVFRLDPIPWRAPWVRRCLTARPRART